MNLSVGTPCAVLARVRTEEGINALTNVCDINLQLFNKDSEVLEGKGDVLYVWGRCGQVCEVT